MTVRSYGPGNPLVFSHIPKTAGTSLGAALEQVLGPEQAVRGGIDTSLFGGYDETEGVSAEMMAGVFYAPEALPADVSLVTAHVAPYTTMERYPGADHITVLRSPQVRLLSQWLHSRSLSELTLRHWGVAAEAFRTGRLPLREYLHHAKVAPSVDNTITRFLAYPHPLLQRTEFIPQEHDDELVAAAIARLDTFAHVNLVENPAFMKDLSEWLGTPLPEVQLNERTSVPPRFRPDLRAELDADTRAQLDYRCRLDIRVWQHVAERVLPDAHPDVVLEKAFSKAVSRYETMLRRPYDVGPVRRAAELVYDVKHWASVHLHR